VADHVVVNAGDREALRREASHLLRLLTATSEDRA
jgi:hypothetical protein